MFEAVVGETTDTLHKRHNNYTNNARKFLKRESCMQQHLLSVFKAQDTQVILKMFV